MKQPQRSDYTEKVCRRIEAMVEAEARYLDALRHKTPDPGDRRPA